MSTATRTRRPAARKSSAPKVDAYQVITDQVIALLEAGTAPWQKPWVSASGSTGMPVNIASKKVYRGANVFILGMAAQVAGYSSPWWGTYDQIAKRGGQVLKGQTGTMIIFWTRIKIEDKVTGDEKTIPLLRTYKVFNAEQAEGLSLPEFGSSSDETADGADAVAEFDAAVAGYLADGPTLAHGASRAYYSPSRDHVQMPARSDFRSTEGYYAALFHELTHSTGHSDRLAREGIVEGHSFGDALYSKEELIAEMGSAFLAGLTGMVVTPMANSASYLKSWITVLKGDTKLIIKAAGQAQRATDLILGTTFEDEKEEN